MHKYFSWIIIVLAIVLVVILIKTNTKSEGFEPKQKAILVQVQTIRLQSISPSILLYGQVESPFIARLAATIQADVKTVAVKQGDFVEKEQLLIELDDKEAALQLQQKQADVDDVIAQIELEKQQYKSNQNAYVYQKNMLVISQKEVKRLSNLTKQQISSQSALETAQSAVEQGNLSLNSLLYQIKSHETKLQQLQAKLAKNQALLALAQLDVDSASIKSPYQGRILEVNVAQGDRVKVNEVLLTLYNQEDLEIRAQVPDNYLNIIKKAWKEDMVLMAKANYLDQALTIPLTRLSAQSENGGVTAFFSLKNYPDIEVNRNLSLRLFLPEINGVVAIPNSALYELNKVYIVQNQQLKSIQVKQVGEVVEDGQQFLLIKSPLLTSGQKLVITQLPNAINGLQIKVVP